MNIITKIRVWNVRRQIKAAMVERAALPDRIQKEIDAANKAAADHIRMAKQQGQLRQHELVLHTMHLQTQLDELRGLRRVCKPLEIDELGTI
jgi:hypothetical protein